MRCLSLRNGSDAEVFNNNRVRGGGAETKLVLRSAAEEDELDRFVSVCTKTDKLQLLSGTYELQYSNVLNS